MEPLHLCSVTRLLLEPLPSQRPYDKPQLLPGIWLEGGNAREFADVLKEHPADPSITEMRYILVIDSPAYVRGLVSRLEGVAGVRQRLEKLLAEHPEGEFEHLLEMYVEEEDLIRLVMIACILAGANAFIVDRPIRVEMRTAGDTKKPVGNGGSNLRYIWQCPHETRKRRAKDAGPDAFETLDIGLVQQYCVALEPYFRPIQWHSGRLAVAIGSFLSYALAADDVQGYLALMTVFEALLSTGGTEITHQIAERTACLLEREVEGRLRVYRRMKELYATRSHLVHGTVENRKGVITYDRLRVDAKFKIVPDHDYDDLFSFCTRLVTTALKSDQLAALLEEGGKRLIDWYLRLIFRGPAE